MLCLATGDQHIKVNRSHIVVSAPFLLLVLADEYKIWIGFKQMRLILVHWVASTFFNQRGQVTAGEEAKETLAYG
jgi:hypothetical protein